MHALVESAQTLYDALDKVNQDYDGNIVFKRGPELFGSMYHHNGRNKYIFTLKVADSSKAGARRSRSGRRIAAACWHVHGHFFDALFDLDPDAVVKTSFTGNRTITADQGNWIDANIGNAWYPFYYSEACEC
jgi:hypothetical protein